MPYQVDLKNIIQKVVDEFPFIESIYFFGSRRFGSGSIRSDIDLLLEVKDGAHLKASDAREFIARTCDALDFFVLDGHKAVSCMNDSYVWANNSDDLTEKLNAQNLWSVTEGFSKENIAWTQEVSEHATHPPTALPNEYLNDRDFDSHLKKAEGNSLPVNPYIGDTIDKAANKILDVIEHSLFPPEEFSKRSQAHHVWPAHLKSEYDCQDLIYLVLKPWLHSIAREEITIRYDGQKKSADFNLFDSQLIIEAKYIDSEHKKREVVKTLDGLNRFYLQNSNIKILLMLVFYSIDNINATKWEDDHTYTMTSPRVITKLFRIGK
jgi:predicted nucleotidyltransferase